MFAQHSQSSETYTRYSDGEESNDAGVGDEQAPENLNDKSTDGSTEITQSQQLLQEVLGETLVRNQENSDQLVQALQDFRCQHSDHQCDEALFVMIAQEVLRHRLGTRSKKLPMDLFEEVGRALWTNENSRGRVERFWHSLGAGM